MTEEEKHKLVGFPYVIGGLSFIPVIGVLFGIIAIIWGLVTKKLGGKKLALIGTAGIAFTVVLYSGLFYFGVMQRGGVYDELIDENHYYLLGVGQDGKPFTSDDILPRVEVGPNSKVGLLIKGKK